MMLLWVALAVALLGWIVYRESADAGRKRKIREKRIESEAGNLPDDLFARRRQMNTEEYKKIPLEDGASSRASCYEVDDLTWSDLEMDKVFVRLNYTYTFAGTLRLYQMLRKPLMDAERLRQREKTIAYFHENRGLRQRVQCLLDQLGAGPRQDADRCFYVLEKSAGTIPYLEYLADGLLALGAALFFFYPALGGGLVIALLIYQLLGYFRKKAKVSGHMQAAAYLLSLAEQAKQIYQVMGGEGFVQVSAWLSSVKACKKHSFWLNQWKKQNGSPLGILADYLRMFFHPDLISYAYLRKNLLEHKEELQKLDLWIADVDACISIEMFRLSLKSYCKPAFTKDPSGNNAVCMEALIHPLLPEAVPNSVHGRRQERRLEGTLLTGSNASGKSTYLKTVAVNLLLAQSIHTVLGKTYTAPCMKLYTSMSVRDSVTAGESYYMAEIRAVKRIWDSAENGDHIIACMIDEVLRGTNTVERIAASAQILKELSETGNILCFAATHDVELTKMLEGYYKNMHFEEVIEGGDVRFSYRLCPGPATTRNAIRLLAATGFPGRLVSRAEESAGRFLKEGTWTL